MKDKKYYEECIERTSFFSLDKDTEPAAYEKERNRLIENLYNYKVAESSENEDFALEIMETFLACEKSFSPDKGSFMHYFNVAFQKNKSVAAAVSGVAERGSGLNVKKEDRMAASKLHKYLEQHPDKDPNQLLANLEENAECLSMTPDELKDTIYIYINSVTVSGDAVFSDEDESFSLFDMLAAEGDFAEDIASLNEIENVVDVLETAFENAREGTKRLLSVKLSALFAENDAEGKFKEMLHDKSFFDEEIYDSIFIDGQKLTNRDISKMLGMTEPNITQIWKRFINGLNE